MGRMDHPTVKSETIAATRIAALNGEIESIYAANQSYWRSEGIHGPAADAEHDRRQDRLKEILRELAQLKREEKAAIAQPSASV